MGCNTGEGFLCNIVVPRRIAVRRSRPLHLLLHHARPRRQMPRAYHRQVVPNCFHNDGRRSVERHVVGERAQPAAAAAAAATATRVHVPSSQACARRWLKIEIWQRHSGGRSVRTGSRRPYSPVGTKLGREPRYCCTAARSTRDDSGVLHDWKRSQTSYSVAP